MNHNSSMYYLSIGDCISVEVRDFPRLSRKMADSFCHKARVLPARELLTLSTSLSSLGIVDHNHMPFNMNVYDERFNEWYNRSRAAEPKGHAPSEALDIPASA